MISTTWDTEDKSLVGQALVATCDSIVADQVSYYDNLTYYAKLYKDSAYYDWMPNSNNAMDILNGNNTVAYNVLRVCVDTLQAKVTLHHPSPKCLTMQGSEELQESAKDMEKFIGGVIYENDIYEKANKSFRDCALYGMGILKFYAENNRIKCCVVSPSKIVVDNRACLTGNPVFIGHIEYIEKATLLEMFPDKLELIESAHTVDSNTYGTHPRSLIKVYEGYKIKIGNTTGRHVIAISSGALLDEPYNDDSFPYLVIRLNDDLMGWYGIGLGEQICGIQEEINAVLEKIQNNMNLLSVPFILKPREGQIHDEQLLTNETARVVEYSGGIRPEIQYPPAVSEQVFQYLETLFSKAFEIAGISQLSATSQRQPGLTSAVAMRTHLDVETQRFSLISKRWERLFIEAGKVIIKLAQQISNENEEGYKVQYPDKQFLGKLNFKDVNLQEDQFVLQISATSALPLSPAGKLERVVEMVNSRIISPEEGRQLIDYPDLEKYNRLANVDIDDLEKTFEYMLKHGKYLEPLIYQNLQIGIKLGTSYYLRAKMDGISEEKTDLVLRWLQEASQLIATVTQAPEVTE